MKAAEMAIKILFHIRNIDNSESREMVLEDKAIICVGRVEDNQLMIRDQLISRFHLQLELTNSVLLVKDLNSKHGTFFDGQRIDTMILKPGEVLSLGESELFFEILSYNCQKNNSQTETNLVEIKQDTPGDALDFYLEQDLAPYCRPQSAKPPDQMVTVLLRTLFVPFVALFVLFFLYPSFVSCLITLGYAAIALALSNNLLNRNTNKPSFSLPVTNEILKIHNRLQKKIADLPDVERKMLVDISEEISTFVNHKIPSMEKDIFTLNQSLVPGMGEKLEKKKSAMERKILNNEDRSISSQLKRSLSILVRQIKVHEKIKSLLTGLILKLEDFQAQLEILEGTIVAQGFIQAPSEFANHFLELQQDIDRFYEEYRNLERLE